MNNLGDQLDTLQSMGLELPSAWYILGAVVFGLIGLWAWRHGKKSEHPRTKWIGVALMFYPYAVSQTWLMYGVGIALCAWIYFDLK